MNFFDVIGNWFEKRNRIRRSKKTDARHTECASRVEKRGVDSEKTFCAGDTGNRFGERKFAAPIFINQIGAENFAQCTCHFFGNCAVGCRSEKNPALAD